MWVFTTAAFTSAVQHRDDHDFVMIRGRDRQSLETLVEVTNDAIADEGVAYSNDDITSEAVSDYKWRITMSKQHYALYLAYEAMNFLTYDNFKNAATGVRGKAYHDVLMRIWSAGFGLTRNEEGKSTYSISDDLKGYHGSYNAEDILDVDDPSLQELTDIHMAEMAEAMDRDVD